MASQHDPAAPALSAASCSVATANQATYRRRDAVQTYQPSGSWLDQAEKLLLHQIADEVRGSPVLDLGVGTGRTTWFLRLLTAQYTAVDFSPEMVDACRHQFPDADIRQGDARDLSIFDDAAFKLVLFSFNGLDSLGHEDRTLALGEIHRVLQPGGLFLYSTMNKGGPNFRRRPWHARSLDRRTRSTRFAKFARDLPWSLPHYWRSYRNWWQRRSYAEDKGDWGIDVLHAHEFSLLCHFTVPSTERALLSSMGFTLEACLDHEGQALFDDATKTPWFHVLARKMGTG
jgi:ubiquinone/menaquinone biosynthesis C-methylase UbiE